MLRWAFVFLIIAMIAGVFGVDGLARGADDVTQALFCIFLGVVALVLTAALVAGDRLVR